MSRLEKELLYGTGFPINNEKNLELLLSEIKKGNLGINLSSFEEIYSLTPKGEPFPIGCVNFNDRKKCFVFSWNENFSDIGISGVEDYSIKLRVYPINGYPVVSLLIGVHSGKVDPKTNKDLWYYGESHLDISFLLTRIKLYQLFNCNEVLFCLFDGNSEKLDSYGFALNSQELRLMENELESALSLVKNQSLDQHIIEFSSGSKKVKSCFNSQGLPMAQEALNVYLERKELEPKPNRHNWLEYLSI